MYSYRENDFLFRDSMAGVPFLDEIKKLSAPAWN